MNSSAVAVRQRLGSGLGASQIASALGVSRWKPPIQLWLELTGQADPTPAQEPAQWGTKLEPIVRAEYIERHGVEVHIPQQSEYHPSVPWARATVDGYVHAFNPASNQLERSHVLEVKTVGLRLADDWGDPDDPIIPDYYVCQAVWQMWISGLRRVDFAVLLGGQTYFERTLHHDPDLERDVVEGATEFWRKVETRETPEVDASEEYSRYLRSRINHDASVVQAPNDLDHLVCEWKDVVLAAKRLDESEDRLKNQILARAVELGAAKLNTTVGKVCVTKPGEKHVRDYEGLARSLCGRLQLRGDPVSFDEELLAFTKTSPTTGSLRRPTQWSKQ